MNEAEKGAESVFERVEGLTAVDPEVIKEFTEVMNTQVIPEIVKVIEERRLLATQVRNQPLKYC